MPSPSLSAPSLRATPPSPSPRPSRPAPPPRRWATRLRSLLTLRSLRRPSSSSALSTDSAPPSLPSSPGRRRRARRLASSRPGLDAPRLPPRALRFPPADTDGFEPPSAPDVTLSPRRAEYAPRRPAPPAAAVVSSALAEIDAQRELFAVMDRFFDEYGAAPDAARAASDHLGPPAPLYWGRLPPHTRHRVAMRVQNAYYIAGQRRGGRHSHLTTELERDFRWGVRTLRMNQGAGPGSYDYAASDDQIEALPTFVMEKGETRSVQQIFAAMGAAEHEKIVGGDRDECGGLMTGYTECAICLSDFEAGDEITLLPCGHFFHLTGCVREWLRNHARTCPTCRADICNSNTGSSDGLGSHSATVATSVEIS